ncbi:MAG: squalene/phytoene synthase family protein [Alphaproteobacteria bacterium]|nr:squalene/phytoene synthase family protein [Alphaproteobacteria bacterium]NCQ88248.1 squalene/phytoene synthase family protein [Alphaproteobacteria bacterium]NCT05245.1 squalene/phytoene synthase family protein [Alphaproteobacteria bacterium]
MSKTPPIHPVDKKVSYAQCQEIVRRHDPDRYLISLLMPRKYRCALWALYAFNYEIAKTREVVSDTTIGLIRLQWWRDTIKEIYEGKEPRKHEVVTPLAKVIKTYDLPFEHFETLIYAREFDLEGVAPANIDGLLNYCDFTNTPLSQLSLKILEHNEDERIVKSVSQYYGLIGLLRAVSYMLKYGQVLLPQDFMVRYNISAQKIHDFNKKKEIIQVINDLMQEAKAVEKQFQNDELLIKFRFIHSLARMAKAYARRIEKVKGDVFDPRLQMPLPLLPLKLWLCALFK